MNVTTAACVILITAVTSAPIGAAVIVSIASGREDHAWTLGSTAPGVIEATARRILAFHSDDDAPPPRRGHPAPQLAVDDSEDVASGTQVAPAKLLALLQPPGH